MQASGNDGRSPDDGLPADMLTLNALISRRSTPSQQLREPGPAPSQLEQMLQTAMHVPDHGRLAPWRFILILGDSRAPLADYLAARAREREPDAPEAVVNKLSSRFLQSPCVVVVVASLQPGHKVPESEQWLSGGAVCLALLQAAHALGFAAQWLTGWAAYDAPVMARLGLQQNERVLGFVHIGSSSEPGTERPRPALADHLQVWQP